MIQNVVFSKDLKNLAHIAVATRKANYVLSIIKRLFKCRDKLKVKKLDTSLVWSNLEYKVQIWNPYLKKDTSSILRLNLTTLK